MYKILVILLILTLFINAQETEVNIYEPFDIFIGSWIGDETGKAGIGKGERTYEYLFGRKYILSKNISRFEPQEKNPDGETHHDWAFLSYDENRKNFVLREFHSEGFINQYVLDSLSSDHRTIIFISENIENAPEGMRARMVFKIESKDAFTELFEIAMPGKDFTIFLRNFWRRK